MKSRDFDKFAGCSVASCARQKNGVKERRNYLIEETCRYAQIDVCLFQPVSRKFIIKK